MKKGEFYENNVVYDWKVDCWKMSLKRSIEFFECSFLVEREPGSIMCLHLCFHVSDEPLNFFSLQVLCKLSRP